jgi:hypothetical protein
MESEQKQRPEMDKENKNGKFHFGAVRDKKPVRDSIKKHGYH